MGTHDLRYNSDCSLTVLDPVNLQFDKVHTPIDTNQEVAVDITVFEGSLNNNSDLGPTGYYECNETRIGAYCSEHDQLNSKPLTLNNRKKSLAINTDYSVISIKTRGDLQSVS